MGGFPTTYVQDEMQLDACPIFPMFIHGKHHGSDQHRLIKTVNPSNGEVIAQIYHATQEDVQLAVESAKAGQKEWSSYSAAERARVLMKAAQILRERNDELARLETLNTGKPFSETSIVDVLTGVEVIEYYAGLITGFEGKQIPLRKDSFVYTLHEPLGVVAGIGAWNYPIQIAMWKSAPALAAGNAMVFKPSEITSLTSLKLAEIYKEAGLPDGVFNVLTGSGRDLGTWLTTHPDVVKISFTGGTSTGKKVLKNAVQDRLKQVTMELGGKSPLIIFEDANLDRAVDVALMGNFYSSGQVCTSCTRVFIQRSQLEAFKQKLLARLPNVRLGDPLDPKTNFGPLVSFAHLESVLNYIQIGVKEGATLLSGGQRESSGQYAQGAYLQPTVFSDCHDEMTIVKEEIFGPVMTLLVFDDEQEVIRRANQIEYGLAAAVVTENLSRAHRVMQQLQAGICWVNTWGESPAQMPVGGYKESGIGRENGWDTLLSYTQTKSVQIELGEYQSVF